ncbi:hypothetical protein TWF173_001917 [Orbilia oligospora]|nr:hypothetical protein TWF173_001917 [Orbilia oligospora]
MEESLGFIATKAQYIRMVNEVWRLKKNIKCSDLDRIDTRERKRARDGKKTGVKLGNRQLDEMLRARGRLFLNSTVSLSKYSPSPGTPVTSLPCPPVPIKELAKLGIALQPASFSLPSSPSNKSIIIASKSSSELPPYISFKDPASEGESSDAILLPREFSPDAAQLRAIISSQVREYLHPVALYNNTFHTTPSVGFSILFENHLEEIFEGSYESLVRASKKYPVIEEVLSPKAISDVEKWLSKVQFDLLESSQSKSEIIYFLKAYMIRLPNNIDRGSTKRMIMDQLLRSGIIKKHIKTIEMILREARSRKSRHTNTSSEDFANNPNHYSTGFELIVEGFATELLYGAARTGDQLIVDLMLRICFPREETSSERETLNDKVGTTTIQYAIEYGNIAICYLLLRQGFDVNVPPISDFSPSLLWTAVALDFPDLVSDLVHVYNATVEIRKDFDFTARNSSLLRYTEELMCNEKAIWARSWVFTPSLVARLVSTRKIMDEYKEKVSDNTNSKLYPITTTLHLSIALERLGCFSRILPSTFGLKRHGLLGPNGLCGLFMVAIAHRSPAVAEYIAKRISLDNELANHPRVDSILQLSIQKINISRTELLLKSGVDIHAIHSEAFQDAFTSRPYEYTQCILSWLQRQGLIDRVGLLDYNEHGRSLERSQRENGSLGSRSGLIDGPSTRITPTKKIPDFIYAQDVEIDRITATIEVLVEKCSPNDRDILRNRIIILSTLSKRLDMFVGLGRGLGVDIFNQHSVHILIRAVNGFQGLSYFKTASQLFNDLWPANSSPRYHYPDLTISWDLGCEPDLEKLKDLFDLDQLDETSPFIIRNNNKTGYLQTGIELRMTSSLKLLSRKLWRVNSEGIIEGIVPQNWGFSTGDATNFEHVMDLVRWNFPPEYQKQQCALSIEIIPLLTGAGLLSLLRLAVHCDAYETVQAILKSYQGLNFTWEILHEAAWFARPETFDLIIGQYWISVGDMHNEVMNFELILLVTIIAGSLYKVINILPFTKIDHDYGRERTPLGVATFLGRLDICKVLLQSGASKYLSKYEEEAGEKGNFAIQSILRMAINERGEARSSKELTDGVQGLTRLDMP